MDESFQVFIGDHLYKTSEMQDKKYFVFDLDETIGSFQDLYALCKMLNIIQNKCNNSVFEESTAILDDFLELYPEFFRPGIFHILHYIFVKKQENICNGLFIYTNNQCIPETWTQKIVHYIEKKLQITNLVNNIVLSFKINNQIVEPKRTTQNKIYNEFIKCVMIPRNSDICFIDNAFFPKMKKNSVYYIQPCPYYHFLSFSQISTRFVNSSLGENFLHKTGLLGKELTKKLEELRPISLFTYYPPIMIHANHYIDISKKMMYFIREYLFYRNAKKQRSVKRRSPLTNRTRKNRIG